MKGTVASLQTAFEASPPLRSFWFQGRPYRVPLVPWPTASRILSAWDRFLTLKGATQKEAVAVVEEIVGLFKASTRPVGWRRFVWRWTPNPFRRATVPEVAEILGFLAVVATKDNAPSRPAGMGGGTPDQDRPRTPRRVGQRPRREGKGRP